MLKNFGIKVRELRAEKGLTKEIFCQDETELSIRQLTRIENGQSLPNLSKVVYIASRLGVSVGTLTDGEVVELPRRYKEIKYLLLHTPTYGNQAKLEERESLFDDIFNNYYDHLPEDEQLIMDALQSKLDIHFSDNINFGRGILNDYFDQVLLKDYYQLNDLIIIDLYLSCLTINGLEDSIFRQSAFDRIIEVLICQGDSLPLDDLFMLNNVLLNNFELFFLLKKHKEIEEIILLSNNIMQKIHDFHKKPVVNILEWKYYLLVKNDVKKAEESYHSAVMLAQLIGNAYLAEKLEEEWAQDLKK
ncbi:helix-turn-helix domain-containing protein [Streptococcus ferus]|uniref:Transcriptional regulator n=1 Tax=Streptococcus ferus TaxID=1345 RepID=A0A2X3W5P8_9STRE|nr:helix-turn-helix domain-containing protein [Streptococcus ferus]SQF39043.1 transcriptional regulator [Streptococcus ferus]